MNKKQINRLLRCFQKEPKRIFEWRELVHLNKIRQPRDHLKLEQALQKLVAQKVIKKLPKKRYTSALTPKEYTGLVDHVNPRLAFIVNKQVFEDDIKVPTRYLNNALNGDKVKFFVHKNRNGTKTGRITAILEARQRIFSGLILNRRKNSVRVQTLQSKIYLPVFKLELKSQEKLDRGYKIRFEVLEWRQKENLIRAKLVEVLGKAGQHETEIKSIIGEFGLPVRFSKLVEAEAAKLKPQIISAELDKRRDIRAITTFTIDPDDAKDFDDALSISPTERPDVWEIGVHIADVSHYVKPNSSIDVEARQRATSVYLVDRTIHMLPAKLSTEVCSLRPHEDKLTFSVIFKIHKSGKILEEWFGKTVIRSDHRFTYEEAQAIMDTKKGLYAAELSLLDGLSQKLRAARFKAGGLRFESIELKVKLNKTGEVVDIAPRQHLRAHELIEEFMLLANKHVATFMYRAAQKQANKSLLYRIHESPDPQKIERFIKFANFFGYEIERTKLAKSINTLTEQIVGKAHQNVVAIQAIKAMSKAYYGVAIIGHYGLGFQHYTHFTSPIRRYPDLIVHRLMEAYLTKQPTVSPEVLAELCQHCSQMEKHAVDCERASIKFKQVEYMERYVGQILEGLIIGFNFGNIYVQITKTWCEGIIHLGDLKGDYYDFLPDEQRLVGRKSGKIIHLGQKLLVRVREIDFLKRQVRLERMEDS